MLDTVSESVYVDLQYDEISLTFTAGPRATEGSNHKGTRLYFVILLNNVEKIFHCH